MKVYKYLLQVIVLLGLISCSSEESDFVNEITPAAGQFTVAFDLSNEMTSTKSLDSNLDETQINTCALFICTSNDDDAKIIKKGFFKATNSCTLNFAPTGSNSFYVYAVANVSEQSLNSVNEGQTVADLKQVVTSIPNNGAMVTNLPKMGGKIFNIDKQKISEVQDMGEISVIQLISSLQLEIKTDFSVTENVKFVVTSMNWSKFSASRKIGEMNENTNENLAVSGGSYSIYSPNDFSSVGSEFYTFPNISSDAVLHIKGYLFQNGEQFGDILSHDVLIGEISSLKQNTKYKVQLIVNGTFTQPTVDVAFSYKIVDAGEITVEIPDFE